MLFSRAARFAPRRALGLRATNPLGAAAASSGAPKDGSRGLEYEGLDPVMRERVKRRVAELSVASEGVAKPPSFSNNGSQQPGTNPEDPLLHRWERRGGHSVELASAADRRFEDIMGGTSETSPQDLDLQLASAHTPLSKVAKSSVDRPTAGGSHAGAATAPSLDDTASPAGARPGGNNAPNNGRRNSPLGSVYERRFNSPEQNTVGPEANPANPHDRRSNLSEDITAIDPEAVKIAQADIDPMKMAFVEETLKQELGGGLNFSSLARPFRPGAIGGSSFSARAKNSGGGGGGGLPVAFNNGAEAMKAGVSARGGVGSKALGSAASFELSESKKLLEESFWGGTMTAPLSVADVEANSDARLQEVAEASLRHVSKVASPSARTVDAAVGGAAGTDLNSLDRAFHGKSSNNSGNDSSLPPSAVKPPFRLAAIVGGGGGSSSGSGSKGGTTTTTTKAKRRIILGLNASVGEMSDGGDVLGPRHDDLVEEAEKEEVTEDEERALGPGRAGFDDTLTPEQLRTQEAYRESLRVLPPPGGWDDPVALYRSGAGVSLGGPGGSNTRRRGFHTSTKQHKGFFSLFSGRDNNNSDDKNKEQDEDDSNAASRPRRSQALPSFGDGRSHGVETGAGAAVFTQGSHPSSPSAEKRDAETPLEAVRFAEHDDDNTSSDDGSLSHHPGLERRTMMAAAEAEVDPGLEGWRPSGGQHSTAMKEEPKDEEEDESWVEARGGRRKTASASEPAVLEGEEGRQAFSLRESEAQQRQQLQSSEDLVMAAAALASDRWPADSARCSFEDEKDLDEWYQAALRHVVGTEVPSLVEVAARKTTTTAARALGGGGSSGQRHFHSWARALSSSLPPLQDHEQQRQHQPPQHSSGQGQHDEEDNDHDPYPRFDDSERDDEGYKADDNNKDDGNHKQLTERNGGGLRRLMRRVMGKADVSIGRTKKAPQLPRPELLFTKPFHNPDATTDAHSAVDAADDNTGKKEERPWAEYQAISEGEHRPEPEPDLGSGGPSRLFSLEEMVTGVQQKQQQQEQQKQQQQQQEGKGAKGKAKKKAEAHSLEAMRRRFAGRW